MNRVRSASFKILFVGLLSLSSALSATAETLTTINTVKLSRATAASGRISGLTFSESGIITLTRETNGLHPGWYAQIEGSYIQKASSLLVDGQKINPKENGHIQFRIKLAAQTTVVDLDAVNHAGVHQHENLTLTTRQPITDTPTLVTAIPFTPGVGISLLDYDEYTRSGHARHVTLSEKALTVKLAYAQPLGAPGSPWSLGCSGFANILTLSSNQSTFIARFVGLNARIGYLLPWSSASVRVIIMGGAYYTTMLNTTPNPPADSFGFSDLIGPQFFPLLSWTLSAKHSLSAYFKYSPLTNGAETAYGATWLIQLRGGHALPLSVDFSQIALDEPSTIIHPTSFRISTSSFSAGYVF